MRREDLELAQMAIRRGWVTPLQVEACMKEQAGSSTTTIGPRNIKPLGGLLVAHGYINDQQLVLLQNELRVMGVRQVVQRILLGHILLGEGVVSKNELDAAVAEQQQQKLRAGKAMRIGEILVARGSCAPGQILEALRKQGKVVLQCTGCRARFNVTDYKTEAKYECPKCAAALLPGAAELDVDDTSVGIKVAEEDSLPPEVAAEPGAKVHFGKYIVIKELFRSSRGPVLRAWQKDRERFVALLMIPPNIPQGAAGKWVPEVTREGQAQGHKVQMLLESGNYEGRHYIAMGLAT